jgi:hypothetical protein
LWVCHRDPSSLKQKILTLAQCKARSTPHHPKIILDRYAI